MVTIGLLYNDLTGTIPDVGRFSSLKSNVVGNNIMGMKELCDQDLGLWMNGLVKQFGCNAILCQVIFCAEAGRQEEEGSSCQQENPEGTWVYMGAKECDTVCITLLCTNVVDGSKSELWLSLIWHALDLSEIVCRNGLSWEILNHCLV
jgi:hypothetical protein